MNEESKRIFDLSLFERRFKHTIDCSLQDSFFSRIPKDIPKYCIQPYLDHEQKEVVPKIKTLQECLNRFIGNTSASRDWADPWIMTDILSIDFDETLDAFVALQKCLSHSSRREAIRYKLQFVMSLHDWVYKELYTRDPLPTMYLFWSLEEYITNMDESKFPEKDEWLKQLLSLKEAVLIFAKR